MFSLRPTDDYAHLGTGSTVPLKTPGRSRGAMAHPRTLMKENAASRQPFITQTGKVGRVGAYPFTPNAKRPITELDSERLFDDKVHATAMKPSTSYTTRITTALFDKTNRTPFPSSRDQFPVTPLPAVGKLQLGVPNLDVPATVLRPSSTRKSLRAPRASSNFETPEARGRRPHWDVSDGDISVEFVTSSALEGVDVIVEEKEDDDEVEYMPPSDPDFAYEPTFELPDYKALGSAIMNFARCPTLRLERSDPWEKEEHGDVVEESLRRVQLVDEDHPFPMRTASGSTTSVIKPPSIVKTGPTSRRTTAAPSRATTVRHAPPSSSRQSMIPSRIASGPCVPAVSASKVIPGRVIRPSQPLPQPRSAHAQAQNKTRPSGQAQRAALPSRTKITRPAEPKQAVAPPSFLLGQDGSLVPSPSLDGDAFQFDS